MSLYFLPSKGSQTLHLKIDISLKKEIMKDGPNGYMPIVSNSPLGKVREMLDDKTLCN